jgi:signal transduction histidine kinase
MQAQLTVPIRREVRVIGAIALESPDPTAFNDERVAAVERLANHAAIAIENARLFRQVQNANAAKTEFISLVSHELRQPMTSIKGYADLLSKNIGGPLSEQQALFVDVIRTNINRMDRLVQDLLDVSRIESGRLQLEIVPVAPAELAFEATQAFEQALVAKHQELHIDVSPDLPPVMGDHGRLIQVLTNLLSNANKYTPEGGHIVLRAALTVQEEKPAVKWEVCDDGIGMTPEELEKLFTKFFRSKSDAVRNVQGTGLGLVITRSIVEMHGGHMSVASEQGRGTTFGFTLPVSA